MRYSISSLAACGFNTLASGPGTWSITYEVGSCHGCLKYFALLLSKLDTQFGCSFGSVLISDMDVALILVVWTSMDVALILCLSNVGSSNLCLSSVNVVYSVLIKLASKFLDATAKFACLHHSMLTHPPIIELHNSNFNSSTLLFLRMPTNSAVSTVTPSIIPCCAIIPLPFLYLVQQGNRSCSLQTCTQTYLTCCPGDQQRGHEFSATICNANGPSVAAVLSWGGFLWRRDV